MQAQPCRVQINASFLVDLRVVALDNGSYENLGSRTETFQLKFENGFLESCNKISRTKVVGEDYFHLTRKYRRCSSSPDFKRTISFC